MGYSSLLECITDLEKHGHLIRIKEEVDPNLEMATIHLKVFEAKGKAVLFEKVKGSKYQAVSNLFGTLERSKFMFRDRFEVMQELVKLRNDPMKALKSPFKYLSTGIAGLKALPKKTSFSSAGFKEIKIEDLPLIKHWPKDGGAFVTLPQVYSEDIDKPGVMDSNLGMYRIQLSGNNYELNREVGLHYQLHRGIGVHQTKSNKTGKPLKVSIFVGGPPAHSLAAVMPLPEGISELTFAGALGGRKFRYAYEDGFCISLDADFVIVVGRPPQEDTAFGALIHELSGSAIPKEIPGVKEVHAVDAAGVHPLLLAVGSERYTPYLQTKRPAELLTQANRILGTGQLSLAKYLFISAGDNLDCHHIEKFMTHMFERMDPRRDLHFYTKTSIDTLDYSGDNINEGSKLVVAAYGDKLRTLATVLPEKFSQGKLIMPGVVMLTFSAFKDHALAKKEIAEFCNEIKRTSELNGVAQIVLHDAFEFGKDIIKDYLWITYTRSNPSHDVYGVDEFVENKHWGCHGAMIIDARKKPHHAPELIVDAAVSKKADEILKKYL